MAVPYTFGTATSSIPLSQLDSNFNTVITLGNTAIQLGNTVTTLNNMTLANVTISSGNVTITNVAITTANVTTANITTAVIGTETVTTSTITTANVTTANITTDNITNGTVITSLTLSYGTANGVAYLNGSKVLTTGSALVFDGTNFGIGASPTVKLTVDSGATGEYVRFNSTNASGGFMRFLNSSATIGYMGAGAQISSALASDFGLTAQSNLIFGYGGGTEGMRIASAVGGVGAVGIGYTALTSVGNNGLAVLGNVGIGTSSPSSKLSVVSTGETFTISGGGTGTQYQRFNTTGGNYYIGVSSSTGSGLLGGASAYSMCLVTESARDMLFGTNNTERMRIDSSGNVGIGVIAPAQKLQVNGKAIIGSYASTGAYGLYLRSDAQSTHYNWQISTQNTVNGGFEIARSDAVGSSTFNSPSVVIDSSGNLLVGQTSNPAVGRIAATFAGNTTNGLELKDSTDTTGAGYIVFRNSSGTATGSVTRSTGNTVLYNVSSDQRLKENVQDANSASALIDSLQVRQFDWKTDNTHQRYGFIAQELVTVAPEAVHQPTDPDEMMAVDYSKLVPMLVKEIQSLRKRLADAGIA
jgi:hypothetical protein